MQHYNCSFMVIYVVFRCRKNRPSVCWWKSCTSTASELSTKTTSRIFTASSTSWRGWCRLVSCNVLYYLKSNLGPKSQRCQLTQDQCYHITSVWQNMVGNLQWNLYSFTNCGHLHGRSHTTSAIITNYSDPPGYTSPEQMGPQLTSTLIFSAFTGLYLQLF